MKKITLITTLILTIFSAFAQWEWYNPLPQGNTINDIIFIDSENGWAVGNNSTILNTTDGGSTWNILECEYFADYTGVHFVDENKGFIVGNDHLGYHPLGGGLTHGKIIATLDGGNTWELQSSLIGKNWWDITFTNPQKGWVVGFNTEFYVSCFSNTLDGGNTWDIIHTDHYVLTGISFGDSLNGWISGTDSWDGIVTMHTSDGGSIWENQIVDTAYGPPQTDVYFVDSEKGWIVGGARIFNTTDGGDTWEKQIELESGSLNSVFFVDQYIGWAAGTKMLHTTDGGLTWVEQYIGKVIYSAFFSNSQIGYAMGNNGSIFKTSDAGNTWLGQNNSITNYDLKSVSYPDPENIWIATEEGVVLNSIDGGENWSFNTIGANSDLVEVCFINPSFGWMLGENELFATTDGGLQWENQISESEYTFNDIFFLDQSSGWITSDGGIILKTNNSGNTWEPQSTANDLRLHGIYFINSDIGWAVGGNDGGYHGIVLKTTDGGLNWNTKIDSLDCTLYDVFFYDELNGWAVGLGGWSYTGYILRTTDGGLNWEIQTFNGSGLGLGMCYFFKVQFTDLNNGWAIGDHIFYTSDGGENWDRNPISSMHPLNSITFDGDGNGILVGDEGTIFHTGSLIVGADPIEPEVPLLQTLYLVYPNPFTTSTTIKYNLKQASEVLIIIHNHLGELIQLINKYQSKGKQKFVWNAEGLPAGIYFCTIKTNTETQTIKMIKLK